MATAFERTILSLFCGVMGIFLRYLRHIHCLRATAGSSGCKTIPEIKTGLQAGVRILSKIFGISKDEGGGLLYLQAICNRKATLTFQCTTFFRTVIFTAEPVNYRIIFSTDFKKFDLPLTRNAALRTALGESVFSQNSEAWRYSRTLLRLWFAPKYISDLGAAEMYFQIMLDHLPRDDNNDDDKKIDLYLAFSAFAINITFDILFVPPPTPSTWHETITTNIEGVGSLVDMIGIAARYSGLRLLAGDLYWLCNTFRYQKAYRTIHDFINTQVLKATSRRLRETGRFILADALAKECQDPKQLRAHLTTMMQAGIETTSNFFLLQIIITLGFLFYSLSHSPEHYGKLRSVVLSNFGTFESPHKVTISSLKACSYLQYCINETLRLYPVVGMNVRVSNSDTVLSRGCGVDGRSPCFVPKGTGVIVSSYITHRLKGIWGEDAEQWRSKRWEGKTTATSWDLGYLPFGGGPRTCLGQQLATTNIAYITVRMVQRYAAMQACSPKAQRLAFNGATILPTEGARVRLYRALKD